MGSLGGRPPSRDEKEKASRTGVHPIPWRLKKPKKTTSGGKGGPSHPLGLDLVRILDTRIMLPALDES